MEIGMEDIVGKIENIVDFYQRILSNLVTKMGFMVEMEKFALVRIYSNYFVVVHNIDILHWDLVPYFFIEVSKVFWKQHRKVVHFDLS